MPLPSSFPKPHHQWFRNFKHFKISHSKLEVIYPRKPKCFLSSIDDHISLSCSQCLSRSLQPNNPSENVVTSPSGFRNMKQTHPPISVPPSCCQVSLERYSPHNYSSETAIFCVATLHTVTISPFIYLLTLNRFLEIRIGGFQSWKSTSASADVDILIFDRSPDLSDINSFHFVKKQKYSSRSVRSFVATT